MSTEHLRCCVACGRWGTRAWVVAPGDGEGKTFVCSNDRACKRRATANLAPDDVVTLVDEEGS